MQIQRNENFKQIPLNIVGSSTFGRYPKISVEKTLNLFVSDDALVDYSGYITAVEAGSFSGGSLRGRAVYSSAKMNKLFVVIDDKVFAGTISFNAMSNTFVSNFSQIGTLLTSVGAVSIAENNIPQVEFSDGVSLYNYDPLLSPAFITVTTPFQPGYVTFHDSYFITNGVGTNNWYLSASEDGRTWIPGASTQGSLQTKPDNVVAVVRFPSKGNMIFVIGETVCEPWFDVGYQLFPYQRSNQMSVDYGCLNPATIAYMDEIVVWLASNEQSGPIIVYSNGDLPQKITTDGIDYLFSQLNHPEDSEAFLYRQDGHLFYHINFYTDNISMFYDFNTNKFFNACDEKYNYYIAADVAFFNNQYYFVTRNNGNLYALDTIFTTFDGKVMPRSRRCAHVRLPSQDYFVANDVGFTIEQGDTNYYNQDLGPLFMITEDGNFIITEDGNNLIYEQDANNTGLDSALPRVDLSISIDGGEAWSADMPVVLNPIGVRKNRLMWWQLGIANDIVCDFKFWSIGRVVAFDGVINIRM